MNRGIPSIPVDVRPYRLSGAVYGILLNHRASLAALGEAANGPPYNGAPKAPVLYIKPRNTLAAPGEPVVLPPDTHELEAGASLGIVVGRDACRLTEASALEHVAGFLIVNDVGIAHASFHRPSIRFKARDGFCPLGPAVTARSRIADPNALGIRTYLDGKLVQVANTADLIRPVARLLVDVTEFMTLRPGDVICAGVCAPAPRVRAGQMVCIEIDGLGRLENPFVGSAA